MPQLVRTPQLHRPVKVKQAAGKPKRGRITLVNGDSTCSVKVFGGEVLTNVVVGLGVNQLRYR